ncbi:MAG: HD domain-containing protein [Bacilli bacterium]|jgi:nicotinate-nucleotide adenylyltransferase|nr:HD domain-containing protein [Bacilli bacterium]MCX4254381.1 bis(5'-nucleosyl)-tetraphosphatase (symmetrical) YqeK [Bacilli bacterium]
MYNIDKIKNDLQKELSNKRFNHSIMVASEAKKLAENYKENSEKAYISGLLHDIAKEYKEEENLNYVNKYNLSLELLESKYQKIIHSEIGALVVKEKYNFDDDICNAIKYHTIGNVNMNMLAKIIFIADKIGRENLSSEYKQIQELAYKNIDEALKLYFLLNNKKLENKGIKPHPNSIELLNFLESE